jgi:hypothetical protein
MRTSNAHRAPRLAILLAGWAAVLGCASAGGPPGWVRGERPPEYPERAYVTALGTGETFEAAQVAAKSELSRVFSAELRSEIQLLEEETVTEGVTTQGSELLVDTTIATDLALEGVEAPLHWRDPRTGEVWALAVLERRKECLRIRSEGRDLATRLNALEAASDAASNPLVAVRAMAGAVRLATALDGLQARSRVLGSQCLEPRSLSTGALRARLDALLGGLSFVVRTEDVDAGTGRSNGSLPQLRERIAANLTALGFRVGPSSGADVVPVEARLRLSRVDRGTDWVEYRWEGSAEIGSPVAGEPVLISAEGEGAESHPVATTARLRARQKGELELARRLDALLKAFLAEDPAG